MRYVRQHLRDLLPGDYCRIWRMQRVRADDGPDDYQPETVEILAIAPIDDTRCALTYRRDGEVYRSPEHSYRLVDLCKPSQSRPHRPQWMPEPQLWLW